MINDGYEFIKVVDLMQYIDDEYINENGELEEITIHKPIRKNFKIRWFCDLNKINDFQEHYNNKGKKQKNYTTLRHNDYGEVVVKEDFDKLKQMFEKNKKQIGFYGGHKS